MSTTPIHRLGIDPGFGNFKIAGLVNGELSTSHIAALVGVGSTDIGLLDRLPGRRRRRTNRPDVVDFDGVSYLVGAEAVRYTRQISQIVRR